MGRKRLQVMSEEYLALEARAAEAEQKVAKLERELVQLRTIGKLVQIRTGAVDFVYEVGSDTMRYRMPGDGDTQEISPFLSVVKSGNAENPDAVEEIKNVLSESGAKSGSIETMASLWKSDASFNRIVFQRIDSPDGAVVVGYADDISDESVERERIKKEGEKDKLTGLYVRDTLVKLIEFELGALAPGEKGVIFYFDVDSFAEFNTAHGRPAGDSFLRAVASLLRTEFRGVDLLSRIGPDEFAVFFRGYLTIDVIERRAQHLLDSVRHLQSELTETASCSMGISVTGSPRENSEMLLEHAGQALKSVKKYGGNRYRMFDNDRY